MQNISINLLQHILEPNNENGKSLKSITIANLKNVRRTCGLSTGRRKKDLVDWVSIFIESLAMHKNVDVDRSLDENNEVWPFA